MPNVGGKKFAYTPEGKEKAQMEAAKMGKKMTMGYKEGGDVKKKPMKFSTDDGGSITGEMDPNRKQFLKQMNADNEKSKNATAKRLKDAKESDKKSTARSTLTAEEIQARKDAKMDENMKGAAARFGMKAGGKVKKKAKSYGHGGKVRGAGIAKKGVKKCKMR